MTVFPVPQLSPEAQRVLAAAGLSSVVTELAPVPPVAPAGEAAPRGERRQDAEAQARQGAARPEAQPQQPAQARAGAPSSASQPAVRTPPAMPPILLPPQLAQAAGAAAQGAALAQDSLAPLMANLSQLDRQPDLPAPLRAALRAVMALQARPEALATPQGLKQALAASGLFLEARLARPRSEAESPRPTGDLKAALVRLQQAIGALPAAPEPSPRGPGQGYAPPPVRASRARRPLLGPDRREPPKLRLRGPLRHKRRRRRPEAPRRPQAVRNRRPRRR